MQVINNQKIIQSIISDLEFHDVVCTPINRTEFECNMNDNVTFYLTLPNKQLFAYFSRGLEYAETLPVEVKKNHVQAWKGLLDVHVQELLWMVSEVTKAYPDRAEYSTKVTLDDGGFAVDPWPVPMADLLPEDYGWTAYPPDGCREDT